MQTIIKSGDLNDMLHFDNSTLSGLLVACSEITITRIGIILHFGDMQIRISTFNEIEFVSSCRAYSFDTVIIRSSIAKDTCILDFTIKWDGGEWVVSLIRTL